MKSFVSFFLLKNKLKRKMATLFRTVMMPRSFSSKVNMSSCAVLIELVYWLYEELTRAPYWLFLLSVNEELSH